MNGSIFCTVGGNHPNEIFYCATWTYNNSDTLLIVGGSKAVIRIIPLEETIKSYHILGHGHSINDLKIHPYNPNLLVSASKDNSLRLWNIRTKTCIAIFSGVDGHIDEVLSCDIHASGHFLLSTGMDHSIKIWDLRIPNIQDAIQDSESYKGVENGARTSFKTVLCHFPIFNTRDVHKNYIDSAFWFGDLVYSKACENLIVCWKIGCLRADRSEFEFQHPILKPYNDFDHSIFISPNSTNNIFSTRKSQQTICKVKSEPHSPNSSPDKETTRASVIKTTPSKLSSRNLSKEEEEDLQHLDFGLNNIGPHDRANKLFELEVTDCDLWYIRMACDTDFKFLAVGNCVGKIYVWDLQDPNIRDQIPQILKHPNCKSTIRQLSFSPLSLLEIPIKKKSEMSFPPKFIQSQLFDIGSNFNNEESRNDEDDLSSEPNSAYFSLTNDEDSRNKSTTIKDEITSFVNCLSLIAVSDDATIWRWDYYFKCD